VLPKKYLERFDGTLHKYVRRVAVLAEAVVDLERLVRMAAAR
jgi:hypothetical protein